MTGEAYVYVMAMEEDPTIKIGLAHDPEQRLLQLQAGTPSYLYIAKQIGPMPRRDAERMEKSLHRFFRYLNARGEWFFGITPDDVVAHITIAMTGNDAEYSAAQEAIFNRVVHG